MYTYLLLFSLLFVGCGFPDEPVSQLQGYTYELHSPEVDAIRDEMELFGASCCHASQGWSYRTKIAVGSPDRVRQACGGGAACSGPYAILISETETAFEWTLVHEFLHVLSWQTYNDPDYGHERFCCENYKETVSEIINK